MWKVPVGESPVLGADTALVTIVEFSDFQCPFCKRVEDTLKKIKEIYGDKVRFVWKHEPLPFHPRAEPAAQLSLVATRRRARRASGRRTTSSSSFSPSSKTPTSKSAAKELGLDVETSQEAPSSTHKYKDIIDADIELADNIERQRARRTSSSTDAAWSARSRSRSSTSMIDEELKNAEAMLAKGVAPQRVYDEIMKTAKDAPAPKRRPSPRRPAPTPFKGGAQRQGRHPGVQRLPVSVLQPRRAGHEADARDLRRQGQDRVATQAAPDAPRRAARLGSRRRGFKQKGSDAFLEDARRALPEPERRPRA